MFRNEIKVSIPAQKLYDLLYFVDLLTVHMEAEKLSVPAVDLEIFAVS
jgi:hypothetical protein